MPEEAATPVLTPCADPQPPETLEEDVRRRLPVRHILRAEDPTFEPIQQTHQRKREADARVTATRGDAIRNWDGVECLLDAVDCAKFLCESGGATVAITPGEVVW